MESYNPECYIRSATHIHVLKPKLTGGRPPPGQRITPPDLARLAGASLSQTWVTPAGWLFAELLQVWERKSDCHFLNQQRVSLSQRSLEYARTSPPSPQQLLVKRFSSDNKFFIKNRTKFKILFGI